MAERTDADWLTQLAARDGPAVADLRDVLCRGLTRALSGRADPSAAEDFAQEAVLRVLDRLGSFAGDGRFLTWALAVATRVAFSELRKARYRDVSLDARLAASGPAHEPAARPDGPGPDEDRAAVFDVLRRIVRTDLTDRQRAAIEGELAGVPQVVLAEQLGTSRNALYKLGHDARLRLKRRLEAEGVTADRVRSALTAAS